MLRKLLISKKFVILTFSFTFLLIIGYIFVYIMNTKEEMYMAICNFIHLNPEPVTTYTMVLIFAALLLFIIFGTAVNDLVFNHTSSIGASGSLVFVIVFYVLKLFAMAIFGFVCLLVFFILSIYTIIFKMIVHEPLD